MASLSMVPVFPQYPQDNWDFPYTAPQTMKKLMWIISAVCLFSGGTRAWRMTLWMGSNCPPIAAENHVPVRIEWLNLVVLAQGIISSSTASMKWKIVRGVWTCSIGLNSSSLRPLRPSETSLELSRPHEHVPLTQSMERQSRIIFLCIYVEPTVKPNTIYAFDSKIPRGFRPTMWLKSHLQENASRKGLTFLLLWNQVMYWHRTFFVTNSTKPILLSLSSLVLPTSSAIMSELTPMTKVLIFGGKTGWIGGLMYDLIENTGQ